MTASENLVIVRSGDSSLHLAWLEGPEERNWDIVVSYFGDDPDRYQAAGISRIDSKGPKWPALYDLISAHPEILRGRKYVWLPDDDLMVSKADINRLFNICATYSLEVAQPALSWDSYYSHLVTLRNIRTSIRFTNFVEIMAPCVSAEMLLKALPIFNNTMSGWGLDHIWSQISNDPANGIAIIDDVTVHHARPVGGPNYTLLRERGISPWDELREFCQIMGVGEEPVIATHKAITKGGNVVCANGSERRFAFFLLMGHLPIVLYSKERRRLIRRFAGFAWKAAWKIRDRVSQYPGI